MKKETILSFFLLALFFVITPSFAQISVGGTPPSFIFETENVRLSSTVDLLVDFNVVALREEDAVRKLDNLPPRVGRIIPVNFTTENSGEWTILPSGQEIWRLCITAEDAIGIMLLYDKFDIPAGGKLFIYNDTRSQVLGAFTQESNPTKVEFATEFIQGEILTMEYLAPMSGNAYSPFIISGVVYGYNNLFFDTPNGVEQLGVDRASQPCEVNINCPEGANWQDQKKGVVRLTIPIPPYSYFCSASVINNTSGNLDPLVLSAFHCFDGASATNVNQTVFYFNYEYTTCTGTAASSKTMTGGQILVNIPTHQGSDGTLLRLNQNIPESYDAYYNGWDRRNTAATSGVSIHHPDGDRKKISTFTSSLVSTGNINIDGNIMAANSVWRVTWAQTQTNWGVTEGGSSGSPIFNQDRRIVGTLTGGNSFCTSPSSPDFYGKLWYHWDRMSNASLHMKPYLDPINSDAEYIDGTYTVAPNDCDPVTNFKVNYSSDCSKANLTWNPPATTNPVYNVYRDNVRIASSITTPSYTDNSFNIAVGHTWSVKVACQSLESIAESVTMPKCVSVYTITASAGSHGTINPSGAVEVTQGTSQTFTFTPDEGYRVNKVFIDGTENPTAATNGSYTFTNVKENHLISVSFKVYVGIDENEQSTGILIYPNPTTGELTVYSEQLGTNNDDIEYTIYNLYGQILTQGKLSLSHVINVSSLANGIYYLKILEKTVKFVKE
ncbi:MAG: T9SS type A sorting domain-containing protein [Lentimicrobiaceae bacterium]|nr:T9SS type A sorting domain-containing protein [Lentimicrobiaceae bacterium]